MKTKNNLPLKITSSSLHDECNGTCLCYFRGYTEGTRNAFDEALRLTRVK